MNQSINRTARKNYDDVVDEELDLTTFLEPKHIITAPSTLPSSRIKQIIAKPMEAKAVPRNKISSRVDRIVPKEFRSIFSFSEFNMVQREALPTLLFSQSNIVVASPTASGKTVCMELALIELLSSRSKGKIVYVAPNKALCQERFEQIESRLE